jgi:hypothetical protein
MIGAVIVLTTIGGLFIGLPLAIWRAQGCPHVDDQ